ncbi:hypothetical protein BDR04DRAFT_735617 [Suillus decipiens]|nr:hypothetical protein BDR04DRAFT_735617 [Suillus decipiens]
MIGHAVTQGVAYACHLVTAAFVQILSHTHTHPSNPDSSYRNILNKHLLDQFFISQFEGDIKILANGVEITIYGSQC